ncbi:MAG: hypothetical protein NVSMB52_08410 [Chloroflexota bacterium]
MPRVIALPKVFVPLALGVIALLLRTHALDHESLWLDEGYTLLFSQLPFDRLITVGGAHEHPPLYYSLVHFLLKLHSSYLVPRILSAVFGALSVVVLYYLGARLFGRAAGIISAVLLAVSPFQIWYSQDGRGYELAGLLVLVSYLCLFGALDTRRPRKWLLYIVFTSLSLYTEYTTALVLLPQALLLIRARRVGCVPHLLLSWLAVCVAFLPWIGVLATDVATIAGDYWIPPPTPGVVAKTILEFVGIVTPCPSPPCNGHELGLPLLPGHELVAAAVVLFLVLVISVAAAYRQGLGTGTILLWLVLPFVVILSLVNQRSLYLDRVFLDATFGLYLVIGAAASRVDWRRPLSLCAPVVAVAMLCTSLANLEPIYAGQVNPDWRTPSHDFAAAYRPGQAVVFNPGVLRSLISAYLPTHWKVTFERAMWSRSYIDVPRWQYRYHFRRGAEKIERERDEALIRSDQLVQASAHASKGIWLLTYDYPGLNDTRRWFADHGYQLLISQLYRGDTRIELWSKAGPAQFGAPVLPGKGFVRWKRFGTVSTAGTVATLEGQAGLQATFPVRASHAYSVAIEYRGAPPSSKPQISLDIYDSRGRFLERFPRTQWYDWPVHGVWLRQPFGFVSPRRSAYALLTLKQGWGRSQWRGVVLYKER